MVRLFDELEDWGLPISVLAEVTSVAWMSLSVVAGPAGGLSSSSSLPESDGASELDPDLSRAFGSRSDVDS